MDQDNPEAIKEQYKQIRIIIDANYKKADLEQEVSKLTHLTKFQVVILLGRIKFYKDILDGNIGDCTGPPVDTPLKDKDNPYHAP